MTEQPNPLYTKLLAETARISWQELQPFFARGVLLHVDWQADLPEIAVALAEDDQAKVADWLARGLLRRVDEAQAKGFLARNPELWAVVVAPWVLIQERRSIA